MYYQHECCVTARVELSPFTRKTIVHLRFKEKGTTGLEDLQSRMTTFYSPRFKWIPALHNTVSQYCNSTSYGISGIRFTVAFLFTVAPTIALTILRLT